MHGKLADPPLPPHEEHHIDFPTLNDEAKGVLHSDCCMSKSSNYEDLYNVDCTDFVPDHVLAMYILSISASLDNMS